MVYRFKLVERRLDGLKLVERTRVLGLKFVEKAGLGTSQKEHLVGVSGVVFMSLQLNSWTRGPDGRIVRSPHLSFHSPPHTSPHTSPHRSAQTSENNHSEENSSSVSSDDQEDPFSDNFSVISDNEEDMAQNSLMPETFHGLSSEDAEG